MWETRGDWSDWLLVLGDEQGREFAAVSGGGRGVSTEHGGGGFVMPAWTWPQAVVIVAIVAAIAYVLTHCGFEIQLK